MASKPIFRFKLFIALKQTKVTNTKACTIDRQPGVAMYGRPLIPHQKTYTAKKNMHRKKRDKKRKFSNKRKIIQIILRQYDPQKAITPFALSKVQ